MDAHVRKVWTYGVLGVFIAVGIACVIMILAKLPYWGDKKPEWIGALGTIAAFTGTIWIATSDRRRRDSEAVDIATLAVAHIHSRVDKANRIALRVRTIVGPEGDVDEGAIRRAYRRLKEIEVWTREELLPLTCLPNHVAPRLQRVLVRRVRMMHWLENLEKGLTPEDSIEHLRMLRNDIRKNVDDLAISRREFNRLLGAIYINETHPN